MILKFEDPALSEVGVPEVGVFVWIAAQVVLHWELRLKVSTLNRGTIGRVAEDCFVELPFDRHQLAVRAEEHIIPKTIDYIKRNAAAKKNKEGR
jgi:hypothetical protein